MYYSHDEKGLLKERSKKPEPMEIGPGFDIWQKALAAKEAFKGFARTAFLVG